MFPLPWNKAYRKKDGSLSTLDAAIQEAGGQYVLPTASAETKGGVKIGSGLAMDGEVLNNSNPTPYSLPTASAETKGGVKIGSGLSVDENGVLSTSGGGTKYQHNIYFISGNIKISFSIINNSDTAFTFETLVNWLKTNDFTTNKKVLSATGQGTLANSSIAGIYCNTVASTDYLTTILINGSDGGGVSAGETLNDIITTV